MNTERDTDREQFWAHAFCAYIQRGWGSTAAAGMADDMLKEFDARFRPPKPKPIRGLDLTTRNRIDPDLKLEASDE